METNKKVPVFHKKDRYICQLQRYGMRGGGVGCEAISAKNKCGNTVRYYYGSRNEQ
jgi:hypothetical protein